MAEAGHFVFVLFFNSLSFPFFSPSFCFAFRLFLFHYFVFGYWCVCARVYVCVCVCVCARACVYLCARASVSVLNDNEHICILRFSLAAVIICLIFGFDF